MIENILTAVGYARTSGGSNPEASIPNQIAAIEEYCEKNNIFLKQLFIDEKKPGTSIDKRLEYRKMKEVVFAGGVDVVIVSYADRLARESFEFVLMIQQMKEQGVDFISVKENLIGSRMAVQEVSLIAIQGEMENEARKKRIRDGKIESLKRGDYTFGFTPYGYRKKGGNRLAIHEEQAKVVQWIFDTFEKGQGVVQISKQIKGMSYQTVGEILDDSIYTGERKLPLDLQKDLPNINLKAPPIISKEQFERVREKRAFTKRGASTSFYFLTRGRFKCPNCKGNLSTYDHRKTYYCKNCRNKGDGRFRCEIEDLDEKVLKFLNDWLTTQEQEVHDTNEGEELLQKKSRNEYRYATGKISYETYVKNAHEIFQQYKQIDHDKFITPFPRIKMLKAFVEQKKLQEIAKYMDENKISLAFNKDKEVAFYEKENE